MSWFTAEAAESTTSAEQWKPSPTGATLRSMIMPGWGEAYAGQGIKAVVVNGLATGFAFGIYKQHTLYKYHSDKGNQALASYFRNDRNRMTWYLAGTIILSMVDAFVDAHLYGFDVSEDLSDASPPRRLPGTNITLRLGIHLEH